MAQEEESMRKWSKIIALGLVLVILAVAYFVLKGSESGNQTTPNGQTTSPSASATPDADVLISLTREEITRMAIVREGETITLLSKQAEVEYETYDSYGNPMIGTQMQKVWYSDAFKVESGTADNITYVAGQLKPKRTIEENPADLSIYGLDKPVAFTAAADDGRSETIYLGSKTPTADSYYVQKAGSNTVYTIEATKGDALTYTKLDLYSTKIYNRLGLTADNMTALTVTKGNEKFFSAEIVEAPALWRLTYPIKANADYESLAGILQALAELKPYEVVAENLEDLKVYGLDKPKYAFDYTLDGIQYSLKVGIAGDTVYGRFDGDSRVFIFSSGVFDVVEKPLLDLMDLFVYLPTIFNCEKLVIEMDGRVDVLDINATQSSDEPNDFYLNGQRIEGEDNETLFKKYYQGAIAIRGDSLDLKAKPSGQPAIRLTYTMKDSYEGDKVTVVELIPTPDDYGYYLMRNGEYTGMIMGKRQLARMRWVSGRHIRISWMP
jgi:hypothetical protein